MEHPIDHIELQAPSKPMMSNDRPVWLLRQDIDEYQESHIVKNFFPAVEGLVSYTRLMGENKLAKGNTSKKKIDFGGTKNLFKTTWLVESVKVLSLL